MTPGEVEQAARVIELLTGIPPGGRDPVARQKKMSRRERREQAARVRRFLAFPPELQEGVLRYGENIRKSYKKPPPLAAR